MEITIEKLKGIISKTRVGLLGTHHTNATINFRPMSHVDIDDAGRIWFFTSTNSLKAGELKHNSSIVLTYSNESDNSYLSINGTASLDKNREKMKELFNPYIKAWFPQGLNDPTLSLLIVQPDEVEYWFANENKMITSIKMLWAAMTKSSPPVGIHGTYSL